MTDFHINETSNEWITIKEHLEARLANLREKNDRAMSAEKTACLRGQIAEIKALLKLPAGKEIAATKGVDYDY